MNALRSFFLRLRNLFRKTQLDRELQDELASHLELHIADNLRSGMPPAEARRDALVKLGGLEQTKESVRDRRSFPLLETLLQDVRFGFRMFRKSPSFAAVAVFTLALGIGANTAIFTVINAVLLHSLPYPQSDRIVNIVRPPAGGDSVPMFTYLEQNNPGFDDLAAYLPGSGMNLIGGDRPQLVEAIRASRNYFRLFGANPMMGRTFSEQEDKRGGDRVLVISYSLWQQRFSGDPSILGKSLALGGAPAQIIGILSPSFKPNPPADAWLPLQADVNSTDQAHVLTVSGRLPPGITLAKANSWMAVVGKRYIQTHPQQLGNDDNMGVALLQQQITGDARSALLILLGAVSLVLLIACANVANLLLARGAGRQKEIAVRAAIGAGRGRIMLQLLTESLLLALTGGGLGLLFGSWGVGALLAFTPGNLPRVQEMTSVPALDPWVAGFTFALALFSGVLFGLLPASQLSRLELVSSLSKSSGRTGTGMSHNRALSVLVVAEVAIAAVLSCGAVLLIRSFAAMHSVDLGFDPSNLLTMQVSLVGPGFARSSDVDRLARQFAQRAERIPGVESAALASALPLWGRQDMIFDIPGRPRLEGYKFAGDVQWRIVSAHYFEVLRIPLRSGRSLHELEPTSTVVINQAMAHKFWPASNPVGQTIFIGPGLGPVFEQGMTEIVGVVGDVHEQLNTDPSPTMYQTPSQISDGAMAFVNGLQPGAIMVRTRPGVAPMSVSQAVQQALLAGADLPVSKIRTMDQASMDSTARQNFNLLLLGLFAAIALLLAAVGIYGVMSFSVEQRTREIGIRLALGADTGQILLLVVVYGLKLTLTGVLIGVAAGLALSRFLRSLLFGISATDPLTFASVAVLLTLVALVASYIPVRRATRVDPMIALRYE